MAWLRMVVRDLRIMLCVRQGRAPEPFISDKTGPMNRLL
jgi:hypothetical protein